jgi:hypothetical protein
MVIMWLYELADGEKHPDDDRGIKTYKGALLKFILSCVLMALVSVHNTVVWIQTWKENVVFLQQICTDLQHLHHLPQWSFTQVNKGLGPWMKTTVLHESLLNLINMNFLHVTFSKNSVSFFQ